jgi:hypothetical protein
VYLEGRLLNYLYRGLVMEYIDKFEIDGFELVISYDEVDWCPREMGDYLGTMAFFHKRYTIGDKHNLTVEQVQGIAESNKYISLPVYMYDHSGITISTSPFSCPWDSGQLGYIFVSVDKIKSEFGWSRLTRSRIAKIKEYLNNEVKELDAYLTGQLYRYDIYRDEEVLDGIGPYLDSEDAIAEGKQAIKHYAKELGVQLSLDLTTSALVG